MISRQLLAMFATLLLATGHWATALPTQDFTLPKNASRSSDHKISLCEKYLGQTDFSQFNENEVRDKVQKVLEKVKTKIIGQEELVQKIMITILADGHALLEGPPGLAKTRAVKTFAENIAVSWKRIQFVSDMMPRDITGSIEYDERSSEMKLTKSELPYNLILGDEFNRTTEKVHSALLEAMEERQFTVDGHTIELPDLFLILATINPIEQRGTFALPEAQLDRFLMKLLITFPSYEDERAILQMTTQEKLDRFKLVDEKETNEAMLSEATEEVILAARNFALQTEVSREMEEYILTLVTATRQTELYDEEVAQYIKMGASPRASQSLKWASSATAWLNGSSQVRKEDVDYVYFDVLRHRIILSEDAEIEGISADRVLADLLKAVKEQLSGENK